MHALHHVSSTNDHIHIHIHIYSQPRRWAAVLKLVVERRGKKALGSWAPSTVLGR